MRLSWFPVAMLAVAAAMPAVASSPCHTAAEIEASEAIRFHTDMMVGSLACRKIGTGRDTYEEYKAFTRRHEPALVAYERTLINRFARLQVGDPVAAFDLYRTELANATGLAATDTPTAAYCAGQLALLDAWAVLGSSELQDYVRRRRFLEGPGYRLCPDL